MPNDASLLLLNNHSVGKLLQPDDVISAVKEAFLLHSNRAGRVFPVVREALSSGGVFGIKSGDVESQGILGFKAAGFWPTNRNQQGEPHQATVLLFDPHTGRPICVIDGNAITTMRTGAAGLLGLMTLAREDSARICIFGTGVQASIQLTFALQYMRNLREVIYITSSGRPNLDFEERFSELHTVTHFTDSNLAVSLSDIVVTATPGRGPLFDHVAVRPGTHLNCVGADTKGKRELPSGLISDVRLFVDDKTQAMQIGEMQWDPLTSCTELGDLLTNKVEFRRDPTEVTVFDMTGLALQDLAVADLLYKNANVKGIGTRVPWGW